MILLDNRGRCFIIFVVELGKFGWHWLSPWVIKHTFSIFLQALIELLQEEPFLGCDSIIIYVTRRTEADRLAVLLRTCLPERQQITNTNKPTKDKRKNKT